MRKKCQSCNNPNCNGGYNIMNCLSIPKEFREPRKSPKKHRKSSRLCRVPNCHNPETCPGRWNRNSCPYYSGTL